jgi:hypothetical protein
MSGGSPRILGPNSGGLYVRFVADEVALQNVLSKISSGTLLLIMSPLLHALLCCTCDSPVPAIHYRILGLFFDPARD